LFLAIVVVDASVMGQRAARGQVDARVQVDPRADFIRANYSKTELRIPMRDGVKLFTVVYVPNDPSPQASYPILLTRTPYNVGPYGVGAYKTRLGPSAAFEQKKYIFVFQDVRGRYMSEGEFVNMRPSLDAAVG
jgi:predicted acyl esterase